MRLFILTVLSFVFIPYVYSQSGWYWQNQTPQTNNLTSVFFVNDNTGYAAGDGSTVLKTIDAGLTWFRQQCDGPYYIKSIFFTNQSTGFLCGFTLNTYVYAKVLKTTNSGDNWFVVSDPNTFSNMPWYSVYFVNEQTGFLGGMYQNQILKTTNGGENWFRNFNISSNGSAVNDFEFINQTTGYAVTAPWNTSPGIMSCYVLKTTNTGVNWTLNFKRDISPSGHDDFFEIQFTDINTGYVSARFDTVFKTSNGGNNWFKLPALQVSNSLFRSMYFINKDTGFVASSSNFINKTVNGGLNWERIFFTTPYGLNVGSLVFPNSNTGVFVGNTGRIFRTSNSGDNWISNIPVNTNKLNDITFTNRNIGFIVGNNKTILRSSNNGSTWDNVITDSALTANFYSVKFINDTTGYIYGNNFKILKTTDEGIIWNQVNHNITSNDKILDLFFKNEINGYIIDKNGFIYRTANGGVNWTSNGNAELLSGTSAFFLDSNIVFASDDIFCSIYKTTNGGVNWRTVYYNPQSNYFSDYYFINNYTGIAVGKNGIITRTTDSGENWTRINSDGITVNLLSVTFSDSLIGFISGEQGKIYKTTNGGVNWYPQISNTGNNLNAIYFTSSDTGYCAGDNGVIIKTVNAGESTDINGFGTLVPDQAELFQNFPNPFNPTTTIRFSLSKEQSVTLNIFDIKGRTIETLFSGKAQEGMHAFQFNSLNLPSGIYFYKLTIQGFTKTKKMIVLK